ncbi:CDK2-associated and cullin domain-containing protein 1 [Anguilla anguilla]|uniref:CDK2-associated and cullin domain-containing protein 1 n=1 Tax=Anguilla anguilla TaxID=7936 RepID=UPI0015A7CF90|nr:CDK2-associated and cullin domain-containing protein 1 [Anguilla anguilla]
MEETMEEDRFEITDDHNHNNWETSVNTLRCPENNLSNEPKLFLRCPELTTQHSSRDLEEVRERKESVHSYSSESSWASDSDCATASVPGNTTLNINNSAPKFLMNVMTTEDYKSTYWPKLEQAIDQLLTQSPVDYIPISYEQIYSCVYKCVCQQHSEMMYGDLKQKITAHLEQVSEDLQACPTDKFIEKFDSVLTRYMAALESIVPIFIYMNKFYIETKLNRDLRDDLVRLFTDNVADKHVNTLMPLLLKAQSTPFQITPSTMESVVRGLYSLRPDWVQLAPALFSSFIPQIHPPVLQSELQHYAAQDQKLQMELIQNGFARGDQSRKRAGEDLANNVPSSAVPWSTSRSCR